MVGGSKNPWLAATLNFFFPGLGYIYNGIGRDGKQVVFGALIALSLALTFYVGVISQIMSSPSTSEPVSAATYLAFLYFLLPFAVAYDGYQRAKSP